MPGGGFRGIDAGGRAGNRRRSHRADARGSRHRHFQAHGGGGTDPGRLPRSAGRCAIQDPRIRHRARLGLLPGWRIAGRVLASPPGPYPPLGGRRPFRRARMGVAGAAPAPGRRRGNVSTGATAVDPGPIRACAPRTRPSRCRCWSRYAPTQRPMSRIRWRTG
ncbi:hypothetical protein G6F68_015948 [Rhizopus microsporus]|nr:hypothetical protein G6F68_015948 [Rhizopus microsporus]